MNNNDNPNMVTQRAIIDEPMYDSVTGEYGKGYSPDNGKTFHVTNNTKGRVFEDSDAQKISDLVFDKLKMRSADGSIFEVTIGDDGKLNSKKES